MEVEVKYYDDPDIETEWNEFNFWNIEDLSDNLQIEIENELFVDGEENNDWTNCKFWQHFWDENMANQSILHTLLEEEELTSDKKEIKTNSFGKPRMLPCLFWILNVQMNQSIQIHKSATIPEI